MLARPPAPPHPSPSKPARLMLAVATCIGCGAASVPADQSFFSAPDATGPCVTSVSYVAHWDDPTSLGFSALNVLARLAGPRLSPVEWAEPEPNDEYMLDYGPERGSGGLELDVRARDGRVVLSEPFPRFDAPEDTTCPAGTLHIPVEVTLRSSGQALDEQFNAMLEASVPYQGRIKRTLSARTLQGGLSISRVESLDPERTFWIGSVGVEALLWEGGSMGSLSVQLGGGYRRVAKEDRPFPAPAAQPPALAAWPSAQRCSAGQSYLPSDARVLGFSVRDVLARLASPAARPLTWSDGSVVPIALELDGPEPDLCQEIGEALRFGAMLRARSEDASLDVRLPVQVEVENDAGDIGAIKIEGSEPEAPHPIPGVDAKARRPRPRLRFDGYRALLVALDWTRLGERDSGSLALRGVESAAPDEEGRYESSMITNGRW